MAETTSFSEAELRNQVAKATASETAGCEFGSGAQHQGVGWRDLAFQEWVGFKDFFGAADMDGSKTLDKEEFVVLLAVL